MSRSKTFANLALWLGVACGYAIGTWGHWAWLLAIPAAAFVIFAHPDTETP
jgi:hypothetical protein